MDNETSSAEPRQHRASWLPGVVVLILAAAWLLLGLGNGSLDNSDDPIRAWLIREMAEGRSLLDFSFQGGVENHVPLLYYWLSAAAVRVFGDGELGLRLVAALASIATVGLVFLLARRTGATVAEAALAASVYLCFGLVVEQARHVREDALLAALLALALLLHLRALEQPRHYLAWGAVVGLAVLTKSVVAALAPLVVLLDLASRRRDLLRTPYPYLGLLTALLVAAPFHVVQTLRHGGAFWQDYLLHNVVERASTHLHAVTGSLYYVKDLGRRGALGVVVVGAGVLGVAVALGRRKLSWRPALPFLVAALVPFLVMSALGTRRPWYVLPSFAPLAVLIGHGLRSHLRSQRLIGGLAGVLLVLGFVQSSSVTLDADFAPSEKALSLAARDRLPEGAPLYTFDYYYSAASYYSERPTRLLTGDRRFYEQLVASPLLERSDTIRLVGPRQMMLLASGPKPLCYLAPEQRLPPILQAVRAGAPGSQLEVLEHGALILACVSAPPAQ